MHLSIFCFALGVTWLQHQAHLPDGATLAMLGGGASVLALAALRWRTAHAGAPLAAFLFGIIWAGGMAQLRLADALPKANEGRDLQIIGVVSGLPHRFANGERFGFSVERAAARVPAHLSLAWYGDSPREPEEGMPLTPEVHAGERWQLTVRLKRPHGSVNPGGFDFEAWLLEAGIRATGTVRRAADNRRIDAFVPRPANLINRLRERVRERFSRALPDQPYVGILTALAIGDQSGIDAVQWRLFRRTGITHLMSISGLHVTLLAGLAYALLFWLWRRSSWLLLTLPAQKAATLGAFLCALGYCLLAGFAVPAQRTLFMLAVVAVALWSHRNTSASRVLALALALVLLLDPWAVLAAGFWLSFGAVGLFFYIGSGRLGRAHWFKEWLRGQWAVTLGMIPALLLLFGQFSLVSPLANALAIPVVSFVVTPLVLVAAALPVFAFLIGFAHWVVSLLMVAIGGLAAMPGAMWQQPVPPTWAWLAALAGCAWLLAPRGFPARWLGAVMFLPILFLPAPRPEEGDARITVLDVGQGLAVHVQTAGHDLLYDAGPVYSPQADAGSRVVVPYLRATGVRRLDAMIITHRDQDHSGGAQSVLDAVPVGWLMRSMPIYYRARRAPAAEVRCEDGQAWQWEGVRFAVLHPAPAQYRTPIKNGNEMSCVLRISTDYGSLLLTSDLEARSERALLSRHRDGLRSEVLAAPHHGSRSSSTAKFVAAVGARTVLFSVGYRNRFRHPNAGVLRRYRSAGARLFRTDHDGALTLRFSATGIALSSERARRPRYWYGR